MTANISTTINVYLDASHTVKYSPGNLIQVPADTVETVIWKSIAPLQFKSTDFQATSIVNIAGNMITVVPAPSLTAYTDTVTLKIDNTGGPNNVAATIAFGVVDTSSSQQPPVVIDGGGSIRNKGTSIWVWELSVALLAALLAGVLVGRTIGAAPEIGPIGIAALAIAAGFVAGSMLSRMRANAR